MHGILRLILTNRNLAQVLGESDMELDIDIQLAFAKDLIEGLSYLHSAGSVHGRVLIIL
jgi:hypothetical protein